MEFREKLILAFAPDFDVVESKLGGYNVTPLSEAAKEYTKKRYGVYRKNFNVNNIDNFLTSISPFGLCIQETEYHDYEVETLHVFGDIFR